MSVLAKARVSHRQEKGSWYERSLHEQHTMRGASAWSSFYCSFRPSSSSAQVILFLPRTTTHHPPLTAPAYNYTTDYHSVHAFDLLKTRGDVWCRCLVSALMRSRGTRNDSTFTGVCLGGGSEDGPVFIRACGRHIKVFFFVSSPPFTSSHLTSHIIYLRHSLS